MSGGEHHRRIDVLAIGLFGLAVGALTLGVAQLGGIPQSNKVGTLVIALMFGGIVQILAGITDIRYHEQLGGTALALLLAPVFTFAVVDARYKEFSADAQLNEIAGNGYYDFFHAFRSNELDYERLYPVLNESELTRVLARELAPRRILVNAIAPGWFPTKMTGPTGGRRSNPSTTTSRARRRIAQAPKDSEMRMPSDGRSSDM